MREGVCSHCIGQEGHREGEGVSPEGGLELRREGERCLGSQHEHMERSRGRTRCMCLTGCRLKRWGRELGESMTSGQSGLARRC